MSRTGITPARGKVPRPPSEQLAAILRARGLSTHELGRMAGVDPGMIGRFLRGARDLRLSTLDRLAGALGLDLVERHRARGRPDPVPRGLPGRKVGPEPASAVTIAYDPDTMDDDPSPGLDDEA